MAVLDADSGTLDEPQTVDRNSGLDQSGTVDIDWTDGTEDFIIGIIEEGGGKITSIENGSSQESLWRQNLEELESV